MLRAGGRGYNNKGPVTAGRHETMRLARSCSEYTVKNDTRAWTPNWSLLKKYLKKRPPQAEKIF